MHHGVVGRSRPLILDEKADSHSHRENLSGLTLLAVLGGGEMSAVTPHQTRTLLDVIKDDPNGSKENRKTWKHFKEKLRLKRAGAAWTSTVPIPASDVPINPTNNRAMMARRLSSRFPSTNHGPDAEYPAEEYKPELSMSASRRDLRSAPSSRMLSRNPSRAGGPTDRSFKLQSSMSIRRPAEGGDDEIDGGEGEDGENEEGGGGEQPVRMSLMALLAESEGGYMMDEEEEEEEGGGCEDYGGGEFHNCCVCMVRHKGEPFEPCGHTFCRLCSRELWAEKGNCPLCNNFILEILDIF
ncbi:unnamed protein product [Cuscuta epithymum]|uniref:RING-type domain-containing protein n=1 Tax=Cuscuta epithymum TaxID=186058 RepID=A0AAV0CGW0_9ASTE|nr:unnamed protein product [Cuscuta epithymum]